MNKEKKKRRLTGSLAAKIIAFLLLGICTFTGILGVGLSIDMVEEALYIGTKEDVIEEVLEGVAWQDAHRMRNHFVTDRTHLITEFCGEHNIEVIIRDGEDAVVFSSTDEKVTDTKYCYFFYDLYMNPELMQLETHLDEEGNLVSDYVMTVYVDDSFPVKDTYAMYYDLGTFIYEWRYTVPVLTVLSLLVALLCVIFILCGAGHRNGKEGIVPGVFTRVWFDIYTGVFVCGFGLGCALMVEATYAFGSIGLYAWMGLMVSALTVWSTLYLQELALRLKMGGLLKHTLVYVVCRWCFRAGKKFGRFLIMLIKGIPLVITTVIIFAGVCIVELFGMLVFGDSYFLCEELLALWFVEKLVLFPVVLYVALLCKKLQQGSEALAEGNLSYHVDTSKMFLALKEHGDNLNRISHGMTNAVEERMKSERLKTELITNVSHDLKTPLTSIINYSDLLGTENLSKEQVAEYAEVLHRQSKRLKKLLEDLVEASKATTGNLEVHLEACQVGVLLTQAAGEYEEKFNEKQLTLLTTQPEEPVYVMADGRHLWRVFDNLLNNIYKYAQENSRVYLTLEKREGTACVIFRNMSKYALNISAEELEERFVRGDKSRHMEGNGLGLSIAKSLVELQNGKMQIVTDGDLFKVILEFKVEET